MNLVSYRRLNKLHDLSQWLDGKKSDHEVELIKSTASVYPTIAHITIVEISELICCIVKCIESIFMHKCYSLTTCFPTNTNYPESREK